MKIYSENPRQIILSAVSKLASFIRPTYGAAGLGILVDSGYQQSVVDDGYAIIQQFELEDELENAVIKYIKEVSKKTNDRAGDGTTTSTILLHEILTQAFGSTDDLIKKDYTQIADEMQTGLQKAIKDIRKQAKKIKTVDELHAIAKNAYRDESLARLVAELVHSVGADGVITLEDSETMETTSKVVNGLAFDRGYISQHLAVNELETLKSPLILVTDAVITSLEPIAGVLDQVLKEGHKDILIIADTVEDTALNTLVVNKLRGVANIIAVRAPGFAENKHDLLEDIATVVGARFMSAKIGNPLISLTADDLGSAKTVTVSKEETIIVGGAGESKAIKDRVEALRPLTATGSEYDRQKVKERIARMVGGIGLIQVGAPTESEARAIRMKVEDAIHATRLAYKDGVVPGGGALYASLKTGSPILDAALQAPRAVLMANGVHAMSSDAQDAAGVAIAALESAVSVAATLITTGGILTQKTEKEVPVEE